MLILIVSSGPDKGQVYQLLDNAPVILGREGDQVHLADRKVSRRHARLWCEGDRWYISDLNSRHGTFHNAVSVGADRVSLSDGDRIRIGATTLVLARMTEQRLERAELLGDPPTPRQAKLTLTPPRSGKRLAALAVAAALAVVTALNVYALIQSQSQTDALGRQIAAAEQPDPLLQEVLTTLDQQQQSRDAALARLHDELAAQPQKLDAILAALSNQRSRDEALQQIRAALANQPDPSAKLDTLLARAESTHAAPEPVDTEQLARRVADSVLSRLDTAPTGNRELLERIAANLDEQRQLSDQIAELRTLIAAQPDATRAALRDAVDELATRRDAATLAAALEQVKAALPTDTAEKLDAVLSKLDAQASPQQLGAALEAVIQRRTEAQQAALDQLRSDVRRLADAQRAAPGAIIDEIHAAMDTRREADARLAELVELSNATPKDDGKTEQMLQQVLAELRKQNDGPSEQEVRQALSDLRSRALSSIDELRDTLRAELDAQLDADNPATTLTATDPPQPQPVADADAPEEQPQTPAMAHAAPASPAIIDQSTDARDRQRVTMTSALLGRTEQADETADEGLTRTEQAYKLAFETGQPVTIGAGKPNPMSGELSPGRTLDPAAAKAAGIRSWRQWYLMDDFAERMRLQQQAIRFRQQRDSDADMVTLPQTPPARDRPRD